MSSDNMNGKINAIGLTLLMIASALAGCTSGDPDGDGEMGIDAELLDQLIQDNLQDFINNTTVTVVNNHYSNDSNEVTNHINSSSVYSTLSIMTGAMEGHSLESNISSENNQVLLVRGDRYSKTSGWNSNFSRHNWDDVSLNGINICVKIGSLEEALLVSWFTTNGETRMTSVPIADIAEANAKFIDGSCDAMYGLQGAMETKKAIWDNDGTMNGVEIWITAPIAFGEQYAVESRIEITIEQEYGTHILTPFVYAEVSVEGNCIQNCTTEDFPYYETFNPDMQYWEADGNMEMGMISECEIPDYGTIVENNVQYMLPGLDCTLTIVFHAYVEHENSDYEYTWSDWAYYVSWTESEVTMEN